MAKATTRGAVPSLANRQLLVSTSHPTRIRALNALFEGDASPSDIAKQLGESSKHVKYHLDQLEKVDLVEIIGVRAAFGGRVREKVYRAKDRPYMDQEDWRGATEDDQMKITGQVLGLVSEDLTKAMVGDTINFPSRAINSLAPNHISRLPFALDEQGWNELVKLLRETLLKAITINEQSVERAVETEHSLITGSMAILQFKTPAPV
jgi:predicted ArsR family transcriptional regulator